MYDTILLPTDGSDAAAAAIPHAVDLADRYGAVLHVLYVADTTEYSTVTFEDEIVDALGDEGEAVVDDVVATAQANNVEAVGVVMQGGPYETILRYVDDHDVDLVVMGTHGRSGIRRAVLGSVTERVVRSASVPVVTVGVGSDE